ncbi:MAG: DUF1704 domain-containing protein [Candidatus Nanohaloarchaea archaeon]
MKPENPEVKEKIAYQELELEFSEENLFEELYEMIEVLTGEANWGQNINIKNREEQKKAFQEARENGEKWDPDFEFKDTGKDFRALKNNIDQCIEASNNISEENMGDAGFEVLTPEDLQDFFKESFRELRLYVDLAENIEGREAWKEVSEKIWPMISKGEYQNSLEEIEGLENRESEKVLDAEDVKEMFEEEIERLGFGYSVEVREVSGCFNAPEERTVVVAKGTDSERFYSKEEAEMLTKHEIFHVVRGINGRNISDNFPEVLGIHSPFYDQTEEGGALYRERKTNTNFEAKDFDYHLRLIAAYKMSQGETFHDVIEDLLELGGSLDRSFYLVARNREALRHHIYLSGIKDWNENNTEKLLIGKLNSEWAGKFWEEVENGSFNRPEIDSEALFQ